MQTLDVQAAKPANGLPPTGSAAQASGPKSAQDGKTGAETARNGSSFLAMIEKMIAGTMDGKADGHVPSGLGIAGRGAGDAKSVPGDKNTLNKLEAGKDGKKPADKSGKADAGRYSPIRAKGASSHAIGSESEGSGIRHVNGLSVSEAMRASERNASDSAIARLQSLGGNAQDAPDNGTGLAGAKLGKKSGAAKAAQGDLSGIAFDGSFSASAIAAKDGALPLNGENASDAGHDAVSGSKSEKNSRSGKKALISVRDERTHDASMAGTADSPLSKTVRVNGDGSADMSIGFRTMEGGKSSLAGETSRLAERRDGEGQSFASMLSQELRSNAADFVKTGAIVLRDNNAGMIRLTLHPESLGNVKISLELSGDKRISGKIVVSSQEAYDAFNENLNGLSDAFVEGGFESAGFDLSWSGGDTAGSGSGEKAGAQSSPFYASSVPDVMSGAESSDSMNGGSRYYGASAINVFA